MKFKLFVIAVAIAAFAALGLSRGALAGSGYTSTSDPECTPLDSISAHEIILCTDHMTVEVQKSEGISVSLEPVPADTDLPNAPRVKFVGPATTVKVIDPKGQPVKAAFMEVCFNDFTKANIFRWWTPADWKTWYNISGAKGRWVYSPTTHNVLGQSCTTNWLPGTFTIN